MNDRTSPTPGSDHAEIESLLGVYALDAVEPDEAAMVEAHLPQCPRCAAEVAEHREVVALLANEGAPAPEGVWGRILDELEEPPPDLVMPTRTAPPVPTPATADVDAPVDLAERRRGRDRRAASRWLPIGAAAAAAVLFLGLVAGIALRSDDSAGRVDLASVTVQDLATRALSDPNARQVTLESPDGSLSAPVAIDVDGTGYLLGSTLPPLDPAQTYQLWAIGEEQVISLGVLGSDPDVVTFHVDAASKGLAITLEVAGGVASSENPALLVAELD